jgi:thiamine-phosphate pyrophosphorylase
MKIYLISPPEDTHSFNPTIFDKITDIIPVKYFQFRPKFKSLDDRLNFVKKHYKAFSRVCKKKKIKLIINDDFEIAKHFIFNGIHLGQNDKSCKLAKKEFGKNFIVGVSCSNSLDFYKKAKQDGADYVAFGPAFRSTTKNKVPIDLNDIKKLVKKVKLPFAMIGGINHENIKSLFDIKPNYVAIIDSLWNFRNGPLESAKQFKSILKGIDYEDDS